MVLPSALRPALVVAARQPAALARVAAGAVLAAAARPAAAAVERPAFLRGAEVQYSFCFVYESIE